MTKHTLSLTALLIATLSLWGCHGQMEGNNDETKGKVVGVGQHHLVVDDGKNVMFVDIDPDTREHLKDLKKGDKIIIVGHKSKDDPNSVDVHEIIKPDGVPVKIGG